MRIPTSDGDWSACRPHACRTPSLQKLRHSWCREREATSPEEGSAVPATASAKRWALFRVTNVSFIMLMDIRKNSRPVKNWFQWCITTWSYSGKEARSAAAIFICEETDSDVNNQDLIPWFGFSYVCMSCCWHLAGVTLIFYERCRCDYMKCGMWKNRKIEWHF